MVRQALMGMLVATGVTFAACAPAHAFSPMPDLNPLNRTHVAVARQGDFDGDGRMDDLYLVDEPETGRVAVHVRLNTAEGPKDFRVTSLDMDVDAALNLNVVHAGLYQADCGSFSTDCSAGITTHTDSLMLGTGGGTSVLVHWQGDHFEQDFVRNDEAMMAQALSALYALNR